MKDNLFNSAPKPGFTGAKFATEEEFRVARELVCGLSGTVVVDGVPPSFDEFRRTLISQGLSKEVDSWTSPTPDLTVTPSKLSEVFRGTRVLESLSERTKLKPEEVAMHLTSVLPRVVREAMPFGAAEPPEAAQFHIEGLASLLRRETA